MTDAKPPIPSGYHKMNLSLADFELMRRLGDGSYSTVVLAKFKPTGQKFALKVIDKHHIVRHNAISRVQLERRLLARFDYEGIATLHFTFQDAISLYMGLEYCPNGELYDQIRNNGVLEEGAVRFYAAEIVLMLEYLRRQGVIHRDLKPENLLLTADGHLKLIDFGDAKDLAAAAEQAAQNEHDTTHPGNGTAAASPEGMPTSGLKPSKRAVSLVGTADYVSPEVLENRAPTTAADLWALGCVVYQMLTGRAPFKAATEYLTFQRIAGLVYEPLPPESSEAAVDLVAGLLKLNPEERLGYGDLEELKAHPFFEGIEWDTLRAQPAPEMAIRDDDSVGSTTSSFDWELQSLAAALPRISSGLRRSSIDIPE